MFSWLGASCLLPLFLAKWAMQSTRVGCCPLLCYFHAPPGRPKPSWLSELTGSWSSKLRKWRLELPFTFLKFKKTGGLGYLPPSQDATATTGVGLCAIEATSYSMEDADPPPCPSYHSTDAMLR